MSRDWYLRNSLTMVKDKATSKIWHQRVYALGSTVLGVCSMSSYINMSEYIDLYRYDLHFPTLMTL